MFFLPITLTFLSTILIASIFPDIVLLTLNKVKKTRQCPLPPGPKPFPVIGCLLQAYRNRPTPQWIHKIMKEMNTEIACIRLGSVHVIPVTSPELSREFLKTQDAVFASRPTYNSTFLPSRGFLSTIFTPSEDQWNKMRRIVTSEILSPSKYELLHNSRVEEADHMVSYILNKCQNATANNRSSAVDVRMVARHYCANVLRKMLFGKRFFGAGMPDGGPGEEEIEHLDACFADLEHIYAFDIGDYMPSLGYLDIYGHNKILKKATESIRKYQDREIDERIRMWKDGCRVEQEDILDVLLSLLKDKKGTSLLCVEEIKAECMVSKIHG